MKPELLLQIIRAGIEAVRPAHLFPNLLSKPPRVELQQWLDSSQNFLLCIGKAAIDSAESILTRTRCAGTFIIAPDGTESTRLTPQIIHRGSHPLPDIRSYQAALQLLDWLDALPGDSRLLVVLSGGSSALMAAPSPGISLESKIILNDLLIRSGATISEINAVRKHCSAVKGGQLGRLISRIPCMVLVISDVIGDDLATIGSGPFYPDPTTFADARNVLEKYAVWPLVPMEIRQHLENGIAGSLPETPKPGTLTVPHEIVASNVLARHAASEKAKELGFQSQAVPDSMSGSVEEAASHIQRVMAQASPGTVVILGGEVTVQVKGNGKGGRNQHLALLMTQKLADTDMLFAAMGTDGIDGNSPAAGAWTDGETFRRARQLGLELSDYVKRFDSYNFFHSLGQDITTGPTGTNVMDLYVAVK